MTQKIGERELQLRKQREQAQDEERARAAHDKVRASLSAALPQTSGKKPVKRKKGKKS